MYLLQFDANVYQLGHNKCHGIFTSVTFIAQVKIEWWIPSLITKMIYVSDTSVRLIIKNLYGCPEFTNKISWGASTYKNISMIYVVTFTLYHCMSSKNLRNVLTMRLQDFGGQLRALQIQRYRLNYQNLH